jgi:hypothetical protein
MNAIGTRKKATATKIPFVQRESLAESEEKPICVKRIIDGI